MNINVYRNELTVSDTLVSVYKYIHVIQLNAVTGNSTQYVKYTHEASTTVLATDGYYTITQIMLPLAPVPGTYYIIEDVVDQIIAPNGFPITVDQLLAVDPIAGGFDRQDVDWFTYYQLNDYYITLIKAKFLNNICNCGCINAQDKLMIDTLTMGIALLDELITYAQYYEAERILEQLSKCTGIVNTNCNCNG